MSEEIWNVSVYAEVRNCCTARIESWVKELHRKIPSRNSSRKCPRCEQSFYLVVAREDRGIIIGTGTIPKSATILSSTIQQSDILVTNVS